MIRNLDHALLILLHRQKHHHNIDQKEEVEDIKDGFPVLVLFLDKGKSEGDDGAGDDEEGHDEDVPVDLVVVVGVDEAFHAFVAVGCHVSVEHLQIPYLLLPVLPGPPPLMRTLLLFQFAVRLKHRHIELLLVPLLLDHRIGGGGLFHGDGGDVVGLGFARDVD